MGGYFVSDTLVLLPSMVYVVKWIANQAGWKMEIPGVEFHPLATAFVAVALAFYWVCRGIVLIIRANSDYKKSEMDNHIKKLAAEEFARQKRNELFGDDKGHSL